MDYIINDLTLPVFFSLVSQSTVVSRPCELGSKPINALHYHNAAELAVCLSGSGYTHIGNRIYRYREGCIQILPPYVPHLSCSENGEVGTWIFISFEPQLILKEAGLLSQSDIDELSKPENFLCGIFAEDEYPHLTAAIKEIIAQSRIKDSFSTVAEALAIASFLVSCARTKAGIKDKSFPPAGSAEEKISPALECISNNLSNSKLLSEHSLAQMCSMSVSTLRRLFVKHTGYPPKVFILRTRMAYAEYLLRKTELNVTEISSYVGYTEVSGFNRTFKQFFGVTPLQYRKG